MGREGKGREREEEGWGGERRVAPQLGSMDPPVTVTSENVPTVDADEPIINAAVAN